MYACSIEGLTNKKFEPKINTFTQRLNGYEIHCGCMDENTAIYCSEYICEIHNEINGPYNYLGYDINEYIACQLFPCVLSFKNLTLGIFNPTKIFSSIITGKIISIDTLKEIRKNDTYN